MNNYPSSQPYEPLPFGMKAVIAYFLARSLIIIAYPAFKAHPALSLPGLLGVLTAQALFQIPAILTCIGLARRKRWAEYLGGTLLAFATLTAVVGFNRGVLAAAHHSPAADKLTLLSIPVSVVWHGFWGFLLYRNRPLRGSSSAARA